MLRLAGCSSGTGVCARGGYPARRCVSLAALCARHRPALRFSCSVLPSASLGFAFLSRRFALGIARPCVPVAAFCPRHRPALRSCCGALRSASPGLAFLSRRFILGSRLLFAALRQTGRLAISCVPVPLGRDRHSCVLVMSAWLSAFAGSLRVWPFLCGDPDGVPEIRGTGYGRTRAGGAAFVRFCAAALALQYFPRGERWGCAPQTAPKSLRLSGLSSRCGGVMSVRICGALPSVHACCLPPCAKQDGLRYLAFLFRWVEIAIRAFS